MEAVIGARRSRHQTPLAFLVLVIHVTREVIVFLAMGSLVRMVGAGPIWTNQNGDPATKIAHCME